MNVTPKQANVPVYLATQAYSVRIVRRAILPMVPLAVCHAAATLLVLSTIFVTAQGYVCARLECMAQSVTNAIQDSSGSVVLGVSHASVTTTPFIAIHNLVYV